MVVRRALQNPPDPIFFFFCSAAAPPNERREFLEGFALQTSLHEGGCGTGPRENRFSLYFLLFGGCAAEQKKRILGGLRPPNLL